MKPILALLIILTLCIPSAVLAGVNTSAVISTPEVTRLEGIFGKNMDGLLGKQYLIAVYDIRSLDADIHAKIDAS